MSLAMMASKYTAGGGGARGDMRGFNFGPPPGTTTYGGSGNQFTRFQGPMSYMGGPGPGMGDPGLFSFLGKVARGVTGVVSKLGIPFVSGAAGVASSLLGGGRGPGMPALPLNVMQQGGIPRTQRRPGPMAFAQAMVPGGETGMGAGCGQGYRPNKSGYYVQGAGGGQGVYVEPNTVCVKRRRMNPLNPRALSKAMRRIESAKRATTVLGRITIRKKC